GVAPDQNTPQHHRATQALLTGLSKRLVALQTSPQSGFVRRFRNSTRTEMHPPSNIVCAAQHKELPPDNG
ncbi:MAG: hypothetical protein P1P89_19825, partial [Desulfobacterales bacterium]|nr:hypothetical protein [Desulfobacterales bacterium]